MFCLHLWTLEFVKYHMNYKLIASWTSQLSEHHRIYMFVRLLDLGILKYVRNCIEASDR